MKSDSWKLPVCRYLVFKNLNIIGHFPMNMNILAKKIGAPKHKIAIIQKSPVMIYNKFW
jgi:hypothetical protein